MAAKGRFEWRRTALDFPLGLLLVLVLVQLAVGNGPLRQWALGPPVPGAATLPARFLALGTVSPSQTARSLLLFLAYAGVYVLTVNLVRRRRDLDRLVRSLLLAGGLLAFLSIVDYLSREAWIFRWRQGSTGTRLTGPFVNPDHWADWLVMLICLGVGYLAARGATGGGGREATLRRYLPAAGVVIMSLAAILTLSRGALLAALGAGVLLLFGLARVRGLRWSVTVAAVLVGAVLGYLLWIGVDPVLSRAGAADRLGRAAQWLSSVPMLASFPVLGVGLGAYKDIYFRFQPAALLPGRVYFPYAHSDLLQFAIETGPAGIALFLWTVWRVGRDLVGAHLLGRVQCPVAPAGAASTAGAAGTNVTARRSDPFSVGIMLGALCAVAALLAHSAVDFSARIPADGVLASACLGMATVAAHTRFGLSGARSLAARRTRALGTSVAPLAAVGAAACLLAAGLVPFVVEQASARPVATSVDGLRRAIAATPSDPELHERMAWALELQASADPARGDVFRRAALAHMERAVALQPENPLLRRGLADLALSGPEPRIALAIGAGRGAVERDPSLLDGLVDRLTPRALTDGQWQALVPPSPVDRAELASRLEARGLLKESRALYAAALEHAGAGEAPPAAGEAPIIRWRLARLLLGVHRPAEALAQADAALAQAPGNPELLLTRARALAALDAPDSLDAYRAALASAEGRSGPTFTTPSPRLQALAAEELGRAAQISKARYHRALAQRLTDESRWEAARAEWERARADAPLDGQGEFSRGRSLDALGERAGALEAFRRAVALDPTRTAFRARLATRLWENDHYMQAISEWQTIASQEPGNLDAHLALARAYLKTGDRVRALGEYRRVLVLAPTDAEARLSVARLSGSP